MVTVGPNGRKPLRTWENKPSWGTGATRVGNINLGGPSGFQSKGGVKPETEKLEKSQWERSEKSHGPPDVNARRGLGATTVDLGPDDLHAKKKSSEKRWA